MNHTQKCLDDKNQTGPRSSPQISPPLCHPPFYVKEAALPDGVFHDLAPSLPVHAPMTWLHLPHPTYGASGNAPHQRVLDSCSAGPKHCVKIELFIDNVTGNEESKRQLGLAQLTWVPVG